MPEQMHIALCQINPTLGDLEGNEALILLHYRKLCRRHDLVVFPELALLGYPPEDLVLIPSFQQACHAALLRLAEATVGQMGAMLVGGLHMEDGQLYNAAFLLESGQIRHVARKHFLPNSGVFDEQRVFAAGPLPDVVPWRGRQMAFLVCEDMWHPEIFTKLAAQNVEIVIVINGSPFEDGKQVIREHLAQNAAKTHGMSLLYCNMYGGQDELVFDGMSFAANASGEIIHRLAAFREDTASYSVGKRRLEAHDPTYETPARPESLYAAMTLGLRDYIDKNQASGVVLGLSGGIDSVLVACLAVDALGAARVRTVMLTSPYTSSISVEDAATLAQTLGVRHEVISIEPGMQAMQGMLEGLTQPMSPLALENIQSRLRGLALMAISNSSGELLLSTGNKSELAVGYATLYGDMCGAYNPLKDLYKTDVYLVAEWRNAHQVAGGKGPSGVVIPERVLKRAPTAELRPDQTDAQSLPPYDRLDAILKALVEGRASVEDLYAGYYHREEVARVAKLLQLSEFKRRQAPPGPKLTSLSFGKDRRFPLTQRFKF